MKYYYLYKQENLLYSFCIYVVWRGFVCERRIKRKSADEKNVRLAVAKRISYKRNCGSHFRLCFVLLCQTVSIFSLSLSLWHIWAPQAHSYRLIRFSVYNIRILFYRFVCCIHTQCVCACLCVVYLMCFFCFVAIQWIAIIYSFFSLLCVYVRWPLSTVFNSRLW